MNFYISNFIKDIDFTKNNYNIVFSDDLIRFISNLPYNGFEKLYEIDPYSDVEIPIKDLPIIIDICEFILENSLLKKYNLESYDYEGEEMLCNLIKICKKALIMNMGLVSIGD